MEGTQPVQPQQSSHSSSHHKSSKKDEERKGAAAVAQVDDRFERLERTLEQFQETARIMGTLAANFNQRSQDQFNQKIQTLISGLGQMDTMKHEFAEVKVPIELMGVLDNGQSPYLYSKELLERTLAENEKVNGKIEMYRKFRASLLKHMGEEMPEDTVKYLNARSEREAAAQVLQQAAAAMGKEAERKE